MGRRSVASELLRGIHVLVVDDDADARELLGIVLGDWGALVTVAGSAGQALALMAQVVPDVLISDISMPAFDGYWLIRQVRALPLDRGGAVPAIAVTALGVSHGADRTAEAGFQAHVRKPVDAGALAHVIVDLAR